MAAATTGSSRIVAIVRRKPLHICTVSAVPT